MCKSIRDGESWNGLTCIENALLDISTPDPRGGVVDYDRVLAHFLKCECGKEFQVQVANCPGKRALRDCGCGAGGSRYQITVSLYAPITLLRDVDSYAAHHNQTPKSAFMLLVREGLNRMDKDIGKTRPKDGRVVTTRNVPQDIHELAKAYAESESTSVNRVLLNALESGLSFLKSQSEVNTRG